MVSKEQFIEAFCEALPNTMIDNIECIRYIFKYYGFNFNNEQPYENGNILCQDCENCFNCVMCYDVKNCKNCWFNYEYNNIENMFSTTCFGNEPRDEPLTNDDYKLIERCIGHIDLLFEYE